MLTVTEDGIVESELLLPSGVEERRPEKSKPGFVKVPRTLWMKNGMGAPIMRHAQSPYEIKDLGDGKFALHEWEEKVEDVYFLSSGHREERVTSKGTPVSNLVSCAHRCFFIFPVRHCEYFTTRDQCKFCKCNPSQEEARSLGITRPVTEDAKDLLEAILIHGSECPISLTSCSRRKR